MQDNTYNEMTEAQQKALSDLFKVSEPTPVKSLDLDSKLRMLTPKTGKKPIVLALQEENEELRAALAAARATITELTGKT